MGRKNRYETHVQPHLAEIQEWYGLLDEKQIAKKLGIATSTFENYKKEHPELLEVLKNGRVQLIEDLKTSLKKKAKGFTYEEQKTSIRQEGSKEIKIIEKYKRYSPPDTGAIHLLLKNLDDTWRNDDQTTIDLKKQKLELERQNAENDNW